MKASMFEAKLNLLAGEGINSASTSYKSRFQVVHVQTANSSHTASFSVEA